MSLSKDFYSYLLYIADSYNLFLELLNKLKNGCWVYVYAYSFFFKIIFYFSVYFCFFQENFFLLFLFYLFYSFLILLLKLNWLINEISFSYFLFWYFLYRLVIYLIFFILNLIIFGSDTRLYIFIYFLDFSRLFYFFAGLGLLFF